MNEIFISCAHIDDQVLTEGQKGWITQFHRVLDTRLSQLLGVKSKIWRDSKRGAEASHRVELLFYDDYACLHLTGAIYVYPLAGS